MSRPYLLDSHVLLWSMADDSRLLPAHADILRSGAPIFVSVATIWECSIKAALEKLRIPDRFTEAIRDIGHLILPIDAAHAEAVRHLPRHHNDPFDRMLVAQAMIEDYILLSVDKDIARYDVRVI